ncbi:DUF6314 family protein [Paenirhodobacter sp.]|uniref:DUF6314 family protein n=1 Tax=Paenirhodobacter sp. TaxID=1965326 RepID=UPI003B3C995F
MRTLADFEGEWLIRRQIDDRLAGQVGQFTGRAVLADGVWAESGVLMLGGAQFPAARRYLWTQQGGRIAVAFADGRPFHDFAPDAPEASHWCDPDDYRVRYDFAAWPLWRAEWRVRGPRKNYTMTSDYSRAP